MRDTPVTPGAQDQAQSTPQRDSERFGATPSFEVVDDSSASWMGQSPCQDCGLPRSQIPTLHDLGNLRYLDPRGDALTTARLVIR